MRRAQKEDTNAPTQPRLSQNYCPFCFTFVLVIASDTHLESESEKRLEKVHLHTAKKYRDTTNTFSLFLDGLL